MLYIRRNDENFSPVSARFNLLPVSIFGVFAVTPKRLFTSFQSGQNPSPLNETTARVKGS